MCVRAEQLIAALVEAARDAESARYWVQDDDVEQAKDTLAGAVADLADYIRTMRGALKDALAYADHDPDCLAAQHNAQDPALCACWRTWAVEVYLHA